MNIPQSFSLYKVIRVLLILHFGLAFQLLAQPIVESKEEKTQKKAQIKPTVDEETLEETVIVGTLVDETSRLSQSSGRLFATAGAVNDPLRSIFALPGVIQPSGWRLFGPVVHGSAPQDNNYFINGLPTQYLYHLNGSSVISPFVLKNISLKKSAYQGFYYDALGGIIDIQFREPKFQSLSLMLDWSLLEASTFVESALTENTAFYAGYRQSLLQSYNELIDLKSIASKKASGFTINSLPKSSNYQSRFIWQDDYDQTLSLTFFGARDSSDSIFQEDNNLVIKDNALLGKASINKGFDAQMLEWRSDQRNRCFSTFLTLAHRSSEDKTDYGYERFVNQSQRTFFIKSGIDKQAFNNHRLSFQGIYQKKQVDFDVNSKVPNCSSSFKADCAVLGPTLYTFKKSVLIHRPILYVSDHWAASAKHRLSFSLVAGFDSYLNEGFVEPRFAWLWLPFNDIHLKVSGGLYSGFPDLLQLIEPIGSQALSVEKSTHLAVAMAKVLESGWRISSTIYYKRLNDLIFIHSSSENGKRLSNSVEGNAYGIDLMLERHLSHKLNGWVALSFSKTQRFDPKTKNNLFFQYDKPVIFKAAWNYQFNQQWRAGFKWQLASGHRYTPIVGIENQESSDRKVPVFGAQNSKRYPMTHQLDFRVDYSKSYNLIDWELYFEVLNLYNQSNITAYRFNSQSDILSAEEEIKDIPLHKDTGLGIIPSVGFKIAF